MNIEEELAIYPENKLSIRSHYYNVSVNKQEIFVEEMAKYDVPVHYVRFAFTGTAQLEVSADREIKSYILSPKSKEIKLECDGENIKFKLTEPGSYVLKINTMEYLFIFADPIRMNEIKEETANVKNIRDYGIDNTGEKVQTRNIQRAINQISSSNKYDTLYFPSGIYCTGTIELKSNITLYLTEDAIICGSDYPNDYPDLFELTGDNSLQNKNSLLYSYNAKNVSIKGRGTIDGNGKSIKYQGISANLLKIIGSKEISIEGIFLRDPANWNTHIFKSENVSVKNVKVINNIPFVNWSNTDGIDCDCSRNIVIEDSFLYCGDDCFVIKGTEQENGQNVEDIVINNNVCISSCAALKIGTETVAREIKGIEFSDINIVFARRGMVIDGFDYAEIDNVAFKNIRIEQLNDGPGIEKTLIIEINIPEKTWRPCPGECKINNLYFKDIVVDVTHPSSITGRNDKYKVKDLLIKNFYIDGKKITNGEDGNIKFNEYVEGVKFE
ncbi:MAG: glycoside hydrolase family 28 protein [Halothermotrichaceae bacterium]